MAFLVYLAFAFLLTTSVLGRPKEGQQDGEHETDFEPQPLIEPPPETYSNTLGLGNILLMQWVPNPIDKYLYIVVNSTTGYPIEQGEQKIAEFTKARFPDVGLIFTVIPGEADYIYTTLDVPVIGIDALKHDRGFMDYLDSIYTIHGFISQVELWAHLIEFQEAFYPVRERMSMTFQNYLDEYAKAGKSGKGAGTEDFVAHGQGSAKPSRKVSRK